MYLGLLHLTLEGDEVGDAAVLLVWVLTGDVTGEGSGLAEDSNTTTLVSAGVYRAIGIQHNGLATISPSPPKNWGQWSGGCHQSHFIHGSWNHSFNNFSTQVHQTDWARWKSIHSLNHDLERYTHPLIVLSSRVPLILPKLQDMAGKRFGINNCQRRKINLIVDDLQ